MIHQKNIIVKHIPSITSNSVKRTHDIKKCKLFKLRTALKGAAKGLAALTGYPPCPGAKKVNQMKNFKLRTEAHTFFFEHNIKNRKFTPRKRDYILGP
jgi:hypothetical protein